MTKQVTWILFPLNSLSNIKNKMNTKRHLSNALCLQDCIEAERVSGRHDSWVAWGFDSEQAHAQLA